MNIKTFVRRKKLLQPFIMGAMGGCLVLFASQCFLKKPQTIAIVNVNSIVNRYIKLKANAELSKEALEKDTYHYMQQLEKELFLLSKQRKMPLFLSEAVITGAEDLTEAIQERTDSHYQKQKNNDLKGSIDVPKK